MFDGMRDQRRSPIVIYTELAVSILRIRLEFLTRRQSGTALSENSELLLFVPYY